MANQYPNEFDAFKPKRNAATADDPNGDFVMAEDINELQEGIHSVQRALGKNPEGSAVSVRDRLDKLEGNQLLAVPSILLYLGSLPAINGSTSIEQSAAELIKYDHIVIGNGVERSDHAEHDAVKEIIAKTKEYKGVRFYGYIDAGVSTLNLSREELATKITEWKTVGADGVYFANFGYDKNTTRDRQNYLLDMAHGYGLRAIVGATNPADVFDNIQSLNNEASEASRMSKEDAYLYTDFAINTLTVEKYVPFGPMMDKVLALVEYRKQFGSRLFATSVIQSYLTNEEAQGYFGYAHALALLASFDAYHPTTEENGASNHNHKRYASLPLSGQWYSENITLEITGDIYRRNTVFGAIAVDSVQHTYQYEGTKIPSEYIEFHDGSIDPVVLKPIDGSLLVNGTVTSDKIASFDAARIVDAINASTSVINASRLSEMSGENITGAIPVDVLSTNVVDAIQAYIGTAKIGEAVIGDLSAEKITAGTISAGRISGSIVAALDMYASTMTAESATIGSAVIGELTSDHIKSSVLEAINLSTETATIGEAKIGNLSATKITAGDIAAARIQANVVTAINSYAETVTADKAVINSAVISELSAGHIAASVVEAINLKSTTATIDVARIGQLTSDHIKASVIEAINASLETATIGAAKIGQLTAEHIQTEVIQAINASIETATISQGKIGDLDAGKITAGDITTDRLKANVVHAINATIDSLNATHATIDSAVIGQLKAGHIKASVVEAINLGAENAVIDQARIGDLDAGKITAGSVSASVMETHVIGAVNANIGIAKIDSGVIGSLKAENIKAEVIQAINASIETAQIDSAKITELKAEKISASVIEAINANIGIAKIDKAKIGVLGADHIQAEVIKAINASIETAQITNAKIGALSADKISATVIEAINANIGVAKIDKAVVSDLDATHIKAAVIDAINANIGTAYINKAVIPSLDAEHIQSSVVSAINANIGTATIDSAKIGDLAAEKIKGSVIEAINLSTDLATIKSGKIEELSAGHIKAAVIEAINAKVTTATIDNAVIGTLGVDNMKANVIDAVNIIGQTAKIDAARIGDLTSDHIKAVVISALEANIGTATINNALIGSLSVDNMKASVIDAINLETQVATINAARIGNLSAEKITAGHIAADRLMANVVSAINSEFQTAKIASGKIDNLTADHIKASVIDAINAYVGTATIGEAKIANLSAGKITSGDIATERMTANAIKAINADLTTATIDSAQIGVLAADKIQTNVIDAINANIGTATINKAIVPELDAGHIDANVIEAINANVTGLARIEGAVIKSLQANQITAGNIDTERMTANIINAIDAYAASMTVNSATINKAAIGQLSVDNMTANVVAAINSISQNALIDSAKIGILTADKIQAEVIKAINASIETAEINSAKISNIAAEKIQTSVIDAINATIDNGTINNAKIGNLSADKITSGQIATDVLTANVVTAINSVAQTAVIDNAKIGALTADKIQAEVIKAINASVETATIGAAKIGNLDAAKITSGSIATGLLTANVVSAINSTAQTSKIGSAKIDTLTAGHIETVVINAINANIQNGTINSAKIGTLDADKMQTNVINAINANIVNGTIDQAKIGNLDAAKITTGTLDANLVKGSVIEAINLYATETITGRATIDNAVIGQLNANHMSANVIGAIEASVELAKISKAKIGMLDANNIEANAITSAKIAADAISARELAAGAVTATEIAADAVNATHIAAGSITASELAVDAVAAGTIAADAITAREIAAATITSAEIAALAVKTANLDVGAVTAEKIFTGAVSADKIEANAVVAAKIAAGAVTAGKIAADAVTATTIAAGAITTAKLAAGAVTAATIAADTITAGNIAAGAITASELATDSVTTIKLAAGAITADKIAATAITTDLMKANVVSAINLSAAEAVIEGAKIKEVAAEKITTGSIAADRMMANVVSAINAELQTATISAAKIGNLSAGHIQAEVINAINAYADSAVLNKAVIKGAAIGTLTAEKIQAEVIKAINASVETATIGAAKIGELDAAKITSGQISTALLTANVVSAINSNLQTATINEAKIGNLSASKITAGDIAADRIKTNVVSAINASIDTVNATHAKIDSAAVGVLQASHMQVAVLSAINASVETLNGQSIVIQKGKIGQLDANNIEASAITTDKIAANAVTAAKIGADQINATHIAAATITSAEIAADTITAGNIAANAITATELSIDSVTADKIAAGSITSAKIAADTITAGNIAANAITASELAVNAVTTDKINAGAITAAKIGVDQVDATHIAALSIETQHIKAAQITATELAIDSVNASHIVAGTITASELAVGSVKADQIDTNAVVAAKIAAGAVTTDKLFAKAVTADKIDANSITTSHLQADSVETGKIKAGAITAKHVFANTFSGDIIKVGTLDGDRIKARTLTADILQAGSITSLEIAAGGITARNLQAGIIDSEQIRAGAITAEHISTRGLDAQAITVYNGKTGETLIGSGFLRVDGLDVGVVQSDNLIGNGLFLTSSSGYGYKRDNPSGEAILGSKAATPGGHQVWKIDTATGDVLSKIDVPGKKPVDMAIDYTGRYAYVTVQGNDTVQQLDLQYGVMTDTPLRTFKGPGRIIFTGDDLGDHKHFFVLNTDPKDMNVPDSLTIIDGPPSSVDQELYIHHNIPLGNMPYDVVMTHDHHAGAHVAYITMAGQGDIAVLEMKGTKSVDWQVKHHIPITAFHTDNYHGGLPGTIGLNGTVGGDSASQYDAMMEAQAGHGQHQHGGYGSTDGSLKTYTPHGIALSADHDHLYVTDYENGHLLIVDKEGKAPYNSTTGSRKKANLGAEGDKPAGMTTPTLDSGDVHVHSASEPTFEAMAGGHGGHTSDTIDSEFVHMTGMSKDETTHTTRYVRYRIPVGDSPENVKVVNGKIFVTLQGSNKVAVIDENDVLAEIALDRNYYPTDASLNYTEFRALPAWNIRTIDVGTKPSDILVSPDGAKLYITINGQNQVVAIDTTTEAITNRYNTGANPKGLALSADGTSLYTVNYGGAGELSFVYPEGPYIGDAYLGLEGGVEYQGAEYWTPSRSDWVYDTNGDLKSAATVEFRINEPFLNEGGYVRLGAYGKDNQRAVIEQDITNVTNYSNGDNLMDVKNEKLRANETFTKFFPSQPWLSDPAPGNIRIHSQFKEEVLVREADNVTFRPARKWLEKPSMPIITVGTVGANNYVIPDPSTYTITFGDDAKMVFNTPLPENQEVLVEEYYGYRLPTDGTWTIEYNTGMYIEFILGEIHPTEWITMDYTCRNNLWFKPHNGSVAIAVEQNSSPNFYTRFEIDEFVPKFVVYDNLQTAPFTPVEDGINEEYSGIEYSMMTNRAKGSTVTASSVPTSGVLASIVDGIEPMSSDDEAHAMTSSEPVFEAMHTYGETVVFPGGLQSVTVDLGKKYMIGQVHIMHDFHKNRVYNATKTEVSEDGVKWITIYDSATQGTYNETQTMTMDGMAMTHYGQHINFAVQPVRYIRDWANGYTEYNADGTVFGTSTENHWTEIKAFGDWEFEEGYVFPDNSENAGKQIATNGKGLVSTDIPGAYAAIDIPIEFTSWWYVTYLVGPEFGQLDVEMPTVMGGSHSLFQEGPYTNKISHRHIMSWPPSYNVKENPSMNIKAGKHRAVVRQKSGRVSIDRFRFEDYQYYTRNSTLITADSSVTFQRHKIIAEQTKWYEGKGRQATEGPYDTPRINPDSKLPDKSVPLKYRMRVIAELLPTDPLIEERGVAYVTSAIFETGKLSSHWRMSQSSDSFPGSRIEAWDGSHPHKTGIQHFHLANGSVRGSKILPLAIMNHHVSPYAAIEEKKLRLRHPTHGHTNKALLDSITGLGTSGTSTVIAREDHTHPQYVSMNTSGIIEGGLSVSGNISITEGSLIDGVDVSALKTAQDATNSNLTSHIGSGGTAHAKATATADGFQSKEHFSKLEGIAANATKVEASTTNGKVKINTVDTTVYTHPTGDGNLHVPATSTTNNTKVLKAGATAGSIAWGQVAMSEVSGTITDTQHGSRGGGTLHAAATTTVNGFMSAADKTKLDGVQTSAINQTSADARYLQLTGGSLSGGLNITGGFKINATSSHLTFAEAGASKWHIESVGGVLKFVETGVAQRLNVDATTFTYNTNTVWHAGNFNPASKSDTTHRHDNATQSVDGFMSLADKKRLDAIQDGAINQASADARYLKLTGGTLSGALAVTGDLSATGGITFNADMKMEGIAGLSGVGKDFRLYNMEGTNEQELRLIDSGVSEDSGLKVRVSNNGGTAWTDVLTATPNNLKHKTFEVWTTGNFDPATKSNTDHRHDNATATADGFMAMGDKSKLDGIEASAINQTSADARYVKLTGGDFTGNVNMGGNKLSFNVATTAGTAGVATTDYGEIFGEHDSGTETSRLVVRIGDNPGSDLFVIRGISTDIAKFSSNSIAFAANPTVSGSAMWHAGNLSKSEFTAASHVGTGGTSHAQVTTTTDGFMSAADKVRLNGMQDSAINKATADGLYLPLTGGNLSGSLAINHTSDAILHLNADTDDDAGEGGEAKIKLTIDNQLTGADIYMSQANNNLVLAPFVGYSDPTPTKNYNVLIHDKKIWHEGNLDKAEFTPASHAGTGGTAHALASATLHGFMSSTDKSKLDGVQSSAINQSTADGRYLKLSGGALTGNLVIQADSKYLGVDTTAAPRFGFYKRVGYAPRMAVGSGTAFEVTELSTVDLGGDMATKTETRLLYASATDFSYKGQGVWHSGNFNPSSKSDTTHRHDNATATVDGFMAMGDKSKLDGIQSSAINQATADGRYLQLTGGKLTGDLVIEKVGAKLVLNDTDGASGTYPQIIFNEANNQGVMIEHNEFDTELPEPTFGLIVKRSPQNTQVDKNSILVVEGNIYANGTQRVWHTGSFDPASKSDTGHRHDNATTTVDGFMAAADKSKLDSIAGGATVTANSTTNGNVLVNGAQVVVYTHPSGDGNLHVPATSTTNGGKFLKAGATAGSIAWTGVAFTDVSGTVTDTQHGARGGGTLHAIATTSANGFMSSADKTKLDGVQTSAINQTTADGRYLQLTGGTLTGNVTLQKSAPVLHLKQDPAVAGNVLLQMSAAGNANTSTIQIQAVTLVASTNASGRLDITASGDVYVNNHRVHHAGNFDPASKANVSHTHTASQVTDLYTNIYNKTEVDTKIANSGDIRAANDNAFTGTNSFTKAGLALKIQPSTQPTVATTLFTINSADGNSLVTADSTGKFVIKGDLEVTGSTIQKSTQDIQGDMNVSGNLMVTGNSVLGDDPSDQTTVRGDLRIEGDLKPIGRALEVARFAVYGIGGDLQFQSDSTTFEEIISHYGTFQTGGSNILPVVSNGGERRYRIAVAYSTVGVASQAQLKIVEYGTATSIVQFTLPEVNGFANGMVRHFVSPEFTTASVANTTFQAASAGVGKDLVIKHIEVIAYDYYA